MKHKVFIRDTNQQTYSASREKEATRLPATARDTVENPSPWERPALASGIVAVALRIAAVIIFIKFIVPHMPPIDISATQFAAFMAEQSQSLTYRLIGYLSAVQMVFLMLFFGGLFTVLRRTEGGKGPLAAGVFAAGIAIAIITALTAMIEDHLMLGLAAAGGDPVTVQAIDGLVPRSLALSGFPQAVVLGGTAILFLSGALAPRWLGWLGCALVVFSLGGTATLLAAELFPLSVLGMLLFELWVLVMSIALLLNSPTPRRFTPQHTSA